MQKDGLSLYLKVDKLEEFLIFIGNLFNRSGAATENDRAPQDWRLNLFWFSRNAVEEQSLKGYGCKAIQCFVGQKDIPQVASVDFSE